MGNRGKEAKLGSTIVIKDNISILEIVINILSIAIPSAIAIFTIFYESAKTAKRDKTNNTNQMKINFLLQLLQEYYKLIQLLDKCKGYIIKGFSSKSKSGSTEYLNNYAETAVEFFMHNDFISN